MAILLGAFLIHGLVPGPDMLTKNLGVTYSMVWSIAIANILGAGICFAFSGQLAKLATLRCTLILPTVLGVMFVGAYQASRQWGDLYTLFGFGILGWTMKRLLWPRPPLVLGFVLGSTIERYMFISIERYGMSWLTRPVVIGLLAIAIYTLLRPFFQDVKIHGGWKNMLSGFGRPHFRLTDAFYAFWIGLIAIMLIQALSWDYSAKVVPMIVGIFGLAVAILSLLNQTLRTSPEGPAGVQKATREKVQQKIHMDLQADDAHLAEGVVIKRAVIFFIWIAGLMGSMAVIGLIPTIAVFVVMYMRLEGREPWHLVVPQAFALPLLVYIVFDQLLAVPWPPTIVGGLFPALKIMPSV
jgi:hypothetical protein